MRLTAAQAVLLIKREASQAERRRFESGHPLISSGLKIDILQAIISLGTRWQHARVGLWMTGAPAIGSTFSQGFSRLGRFMA